MGCVVLHFHPFTCCMLSVFGYYLKPHIDPSPMLRAKANRSKNAAGHRPTMHAHCGHAMGQGRQASLAIVQAGFPSALMWPHLNTDTLPDSEPHTTTGELGEKSMQDSRLPALWVTTGFTVLRPKSHTCGRVAQVAKLRACSQQRHKVKKGFLAGAQQLKARQCGKSWSKQ